MPIFPNLDRLSIIFKLTNLLQLKLKSIYIILDYLNSHTDYTTTFFVFKIYIFFYLF